MTAPGSGWDGLSWIFDPDATCICCGAPTTSLLDVACAFPHVGDARSLPVLENHALLESTGDILTSDFCRLGADRFLRCILELRLSGRPELVTLGVWASLSASDFDLYCRHFDDRAPGDLPNMGIWLASSLPLPYDLPAACTLVPQPQGLRPLLEAQDSAPTLLRLQQDGLTPSEALSFLQALGHDITPDQQLRS